MFNILFVTEQDRKHVVHCQSCARKINSRLEGFVVLNQYHLEDLIDVYNNLQLHTVLQQGRRAEAETVTVI